VRTTRRELLALFASTAAAEWPRAVWGQQGGKVPIIGFMGSEALAWSSWTTAFVRRLRELGWNEGHTIAIEYRWSEGHPERETEIAAEFVRLNVACIVTAGAAVLAAKRATTVIPIVFSIANDPVGAGYVDNLSRPGGNVTGMSVQATDLAGKRLEILREVLPDVRRLAIMGNGLYPAAALEIKETETKARMLGLEATRAEIERAGDIPTAFDRLKGRVDALYLIGDALVNTNRVRVITLSLAARLPTIFNTRDYVQAGGLMSYGPNYPDLLRRAADLVDKILRGTKVADIPVEQPTKFDLVVNLTTARALSLTIPPTLLARADEVIE
jgi:ABC-type uncharacterized transport system substrate-binding protein